MVFSIQDRLATAKQFGNYWKGKSELILGLGMPQLDSFPPEELPPRMRAVVLPAWAEDCGVNGSLLIPTAALSGANSDWNNVDWIFALHWYVHGLAERAHEERHGPIHSYSFKLSQWPEAIWEHAWANRIALLLRRMAARTQQTSEEALFGPLPTPSFTITHDVDAVRKTFAIRCKQSVFHLFNAVRAAASGRPRNAVSKIRQGIHFLHSSVDYWSFPGIRAQEMACELRSHFNFYAGLHRRGWERLIDPSYDIAEPRIQAAIKELIAGGWTIGLHQAFNSWKDSEPMIQERHRLNDISGTTIHSCRQHWLRFGWANTWQAQERAGFSLDTSLGFNDRCGFRNGTAQDIQPLGCVKLRARPMVLMDSHLYDYADLTDASRQRCLTRILDEVAAVRGSATIIWHTHVLGSDYNWASGFATLLREVTQRQ